MRLLAGKLVELGIVESISHETVRLTLKKQLIAEIRKGVPGRPGQVERYDYEYQRNEVRNLNMAFEPLIGKRHKRITERHTSQDFAHCMKWLVDEVHPEAEVIRIVMDNLGPHKPAALYETFPHEEARRSAKKLEFHYTPKLGSWLNMAEIELSVYSRSLKHHIPTKEMLKNEVRALTDERNMDQAKVNWQFFAADARIKLKQLYPSISN